MEIQYARDNISAFPLAEFLIEPALNSAMLVQILYNGVEPADPGWAVTERRKGL